MHRKSISILFIASLLLAAPALFASDHHPCSSRSVAGTYGYTVNGVRIGIGPAASVGLVTLGDDGSVTDGKQTASFNGLILNETLTGTYTVNDDCSGSAVLNVISSNPAFNRTSTLDLVWVDDSDELRMIFSGANQILTGDGKKRR